MLKKISLILLLFITLKSFGVSYTAVTDECPYIRFSGTTLQDIVVDKSNIKLQKTSSSVIVTFLSGGAQTLSWSSAQARSYGYSLDSLYLFILDNLMTTCNGGGGSGDSTFAKNGLYKSGDTVKLGDSLTENTIINGNGFNFLINGTDFPDDIFTSNLGLGGQADIDTISGYIAAGVHTGNGIGINTYGTSVGGVGSYNSGYSDSSRGYYIDGMSPYGIGSLFHGSSTDSFGVYIDGYSANSDAVLVYGEGGAGRTDILLHAKNGNLKIENLSTDNTADQLLAKNAAGFAVWYDVDSLQGQNFANADLTANGDRYHNFSGYEFTMDSLKQFKVFSYDGDGNRYGFRNSDDPLLFVEYASTNMQLSKDVMQLSADTSIDFITPKVNAGSSDVYIGNAFLYDSPNGNFLNLIAEDGGLGILTPGNASYAQIRQEQLTLIDNDQWGNSISTNGFSTHDNNLVVPDTSGILVVSVNDSIADNKGNVNLGLAAITAKGNTTPDAIYIQDVSTNVVELYNDASDGHVTIKTSYDNKGSDIQPGVITLYNSAGLGSAITVSNSIAYTGINSLNPPDNSGIIPLFVNGVASDTFGNINLPETYIQTSYSAATTLASNGLLAKGATYKITGCHPGLYNDGVTDTTTIFLQALDSAHFSQSGQGLFYNVSYDHGVTGNGIWSRLSTFDTTSTTGFLEPNEGITANNGATGVLLTDVNSLAFIPAYPSTGDWTTATSFTGNSSGQTVNLASVTLKVYNIDDYAVYGGYLWKNLTGELGSAVDALTLDGTNWEKAPYSSGFYGEVLDDISFDFSNNFITRRYEARNDNEVIFTKQDQDYFNTALGIPGNAISLFQWGNNLETFGTRGVGNNIVKNSIYDNINSGYDWIGNNSVTGRSYLTETNNYGGNFFDNNFTSTSTIYNLTGYESDISNLVGVNVDIHEVSNGKTCQISNIELAQNAQFRQIFTTNVTQLSNGSILTEGSIHDLILDNVTMKNFTATTGSEITSLNLKNCIAEDLNADNHSTIDCIVSDGFDVSNINLNNYQFNLGCTPLTVDVDSISLDGNVVLFNVDGSATLATGTVTVSNTNITANSRIMLTGNGNANAGFLTVTKTAGVGFTIDSSNILDARVVDYVIKY